MTWQTKKLSEITEISSGNSAPQKKEYFNNGLSPFFRTSDVGNVHLSDNLLNTRDYLNEKGIKGLKLFPKGTILFPKSGASTFLNHRVIMGCDGYVSSHLATITPKESSVYSKYLYYFLTTIDAKQIAPNSAYPSLKISDIGKLEIPLPPLVTQHKIVAILDEKFAKLREAKRLRQEAIRDTEKILAATLKEIFEEGKEKGWEEKLIKDICEHPQYGFTASSTQDPVGPKMLRITDIQDGAVDWDTVPYCQCDDVAKYQLKKDDLVFARTGATVGKSFLITEDPENAVYASYLIRLRTKANISSEFLYYFFQSPNYWNQITENAVGGAQPNVNGTKLANLNIFVPPLTEQQKIVTRLDALSEKLRTLRELQQSQLEDMKKLEKAYLREVFRGELV